MRARSLAALTAAVTPLLLPTIANAATEHLLLDSYDNAGAPYSRVVTTSQAVAPGTTATIVVHGTYALYTRALMAASQKPYTICGSPVIADPETPSPGVADSIAGFDAEFIYRRPFIGGCPAQPLPLKSGGFEVSTGAAWAHPAAVGAPAAPTADHAYTYTVQGTGAPLRFRVRDDFTADNDGVLTLAVSIPNAAVGTTQTTKPASPVLALSSAKSCVSRRNFTIHLTTRKGDGAVSATVRVNGKTTKVVKRRSGKSRLISAVDLRGLPAGTVKVQVVVRTKSGKVLTSKRTYHTCVARKSGAA